MIGPMPAKGPVQNSVALDIERRAKRMKDKLTGVVRHLLFFCLLSVSFIVK